MGDFASKPSTHKLRIFFPNLDGLRFFSFLMVFFSHSFATSDQDIRSQAWYQLFKGRLFHHGDLGVSFFFVLSGFLISYLLIKEKELTGTIRVRSFYVRRILRIWPLYYFCVLFGFVAFPIVKSMLGKEPTETADPILCSLFLNNYNAILNGPPDSSVLSVLWSVAIEEQFYVLWPLCFYLVPFRKHSYIFLVTIATSVLYRAIHCGQNADLSTLGVISDMAVGGLGAHLSITWPSFLQKVETSNRWVNLSPYLVTVFFIVNKHDIFEGAFMSVAHRLVTSIFFLWIILEQNFANTSFFKMSQFTGVSRLGKYTYGLYCLHTIALLVVVTSLNKLDLNRYAWQLWLIELPLSMLLSIILSYFSYHFFEKPFLSLKETFSIITKD